MQVSSFMAPAYAFFELIQYWRPTSPNQRMLPCLSIRHTRPMAAKSLSKSLLKRLDLLECCLACRLVVRKSERGCARYRLDAMVLVG